MFNPWLTCFKSRTHDLLDGIKEKGLKGEHVDFVWVEFTSSLDSVDLVTDLIDRSVAESYVDEVQDLLLIDARRTFCNNAL